MGINNVDGKLAFTYTINIIILYYIDHIIMNYHQYKKSLVTEINTLNKIIDDKIVRGLPYSKEALRHKSLSKELKRLSGKSYLSNLVSTLTLF